MEDVQRDIEVVARRTRIAYATALGVALLVNLSGWLVAGTSGDAASEIRRGAVTVVLVGAFVALQRLPHLADRIMRIGLVVGGVAALIAWTRQLFPGTGSALADPTVLGLSIVVIGTFALFPPRIALRATAALTAVVATLTAFATISSDVSATGATYLLRQVAALVLVIALANMATVGRERLHAALGRAELLQELATTDPLTGLANRRAAMDTLGRETQRALRYGSHVSVMLIDLDEFKDVNDRHGHSAGDDVLCGVASILQTTVRESDFVARWGGEEFLVVTPQTTAEQASLLAERVRRQIAHGRPGGHHVTASFGIAEFDTAESVDRMLTRVDRLLYDAKDRGRNQVVHQT